MCPTPNPLRGKELFSDKPNPVAGSRRPRDTPPKNRPCGGFFLPRIEPALSPLPATQHLEQYLAKVFLTLVWAASEQYEAWRRNPLPLALHELGSHLRTEVLSAVSALGREYRVVYGSANIQGQIAATESGLAVAVMPRCSVPPSLKILDSHQGLPPLPKMEVTLVRSKDSARSPAVDMFYSEALRWVRLMWACVRIRSSQKLPRLRV